VTGRILEGVTPEAYHQRDGLSASIATTLITRSPLHAWQQHPRFGGRGKAPTRAMDIGTVAHELVLGKGKGFEVLPFDDYRTKAAQSARDAARAAGRTPILAEEFDAAQALAERLRHQLAERGILLDGASEVAFEWTEASESGPVLCRGMADHLRAAGTRATIIDLKFCESAAPPSVERSAENFGYAIQAAAYTRALAAWRPALAGRVEFLFVFAEKEPPHAVNVCAPSGAFREIGERRWLRAVETWGRCLKAQHWPSYGDTVNQLHPPAWALAREGEF
jgi:hypothetical protein